MTLEIGYVLFLIVVALVLFATEILTIDVIGLVLLLALTVPGIIAPGQALAGFGSETIIVLIGLFVLTAGVTETGVVERIGLKLAAFGSDRPKAMTRMLITSATAMSAFISNTITTAVLLPLTMGSAKRAGVSVAKVLMPLAYASILAGSITVIATSTNLVISGELPRYGLEKIGFFELAPVGIGMTVVGLVYLLFLAPRFIPDRFKGDRVETYGLRKYISEMVISTGSKLAGKTLAESKLGETLDLVVLGVRRDGTRDLRPRANTVLKEGDVLLVEGSAEDILSVKDVMGIDIHAKFEARDPDLESEEVRMVEVMAMPDSIWVGKSAGGANFRQSTGMTVLAIHSPGRKRDYRRRLARQRIKAGDVLLLQGSVEDIERLEPRELLNLEDVSRHHPRTPRGRIALAIFVVSIAVAATGLLPMSIAFLGGIVALLLTRCIQPEEGYRAIDWRLLGGRARQPAGQHRGAGGLLRADRFPNSADVESGRGAHRPAGGDRGFSDAGYRSPIAGDVGYLRRLLLVSHPARARLHPGLRSRPLPLLRLLQGRPAIDHRGVYLLHAAHPGLLALQSGRLDPRLRGPSPTALDG
jgi:di/tricarboxylate transporter